CVEAALTQGRGPQIISPGKYDSSIESKLASSGRHSRKYRSIQNVSVAWNGVALPCQIFSSFFAICAWPDRKGYGGGGRIAVWPPIKRWSADGLRRASAMLRARRSAVPDAPE